jgi:hypothetical protein
MMLVVGVAEPWAKCTAVLFVLESDHATAVGVSHAAGGSNATPLK